MTATASYSKKSSMSAADSRAVAEALNAERWFEIPSSNIRPGDCIRIVNRGGRLIEATVRDDHGTLVCDFEPLTPSLMKWMQDKGYPITRLNVPALRGDTLALLDFVRKMDLDFALQCAYANEVSEADAYAMFEDDSKGDEWWTVWVYAKKIASQRVRAIDVRLTPMTEVIAATIAAAVMATEFEGGSLGYTDQRFLSRSFANARDAYMRSRVAA